MVRQKVQIFIYFFYELSVREESLCNNFGCPSQTKNKCNIFDKAVLQITCFGWCLHFYPYDLIECDVQSWPGGSDPRIKLLGAQNSAQTHQYYCTLFYIQDFAKTE